MTDEDELKTWRERACELKDAGLTAKQIADTLNEEGYTHSRGMSFTDRTVYSFQMRKKVNRDTDQPYQFERRRNIRRPGD